MNISVVSQINKQGNYRTGSIIAGKLPILQNTALKSAQEKAERQQKADSQVAFWEKQKESLKSSECDTVEEIAKKLETLHDYEDEIAAVKKAYNHEQMFHILDEAEETGEKIAEAAEKMEPKTPEERREELAEETLGTEEDKGVLEEMMEEASETLKKAAEASEEMTDMLEESEEALEETTEMPEEIEEMLEETADLLEEPQEVLEETPQRLHGNSVYDFYRVSNGREWERRYQGVDIKI